ncbi:helix-turn-helix domain-containing protein [Candidatus Bathyarchaeota archaeon]|nr:helix-turn-helix domain-containing protein [Candidatus Bathyarchaeota archaeon]
MSKRRNIWRELEVGFGGGSKFRILLHLALHPREAHTKYSLVRATGLRTPTVGEYLKTLVELGWVKEYPFTPRTYQINADHAIIRCFIDFLEKIKNIRGSSSR